MKMKLTLKRILTSVLAGVMLISSMARMSGCKEMIKEYFEDGPVYVYGDFRYCYVYSINSRRPAKKETQYLAVIGLMPEAREKKVIVVPKTIEGKPVSLIGLTRFMGTEGLSDTGTYRKIYIPDTVLRIASSYEDVYHKKVFLMDDIKNFNFENREILFNGANGLSHAECYVAETLYEEYQSLIEGEDVGYIHIANLTSVVDGEVSWIDDYEEGEHITVPQEPQKDGYVFAGWYEDEEYTDEWDFETETYHLEEESNTKNLYGKFIKQE